MHDLLPDNIAAVAELCGSAEPYRSISTAIWLELTVPGASGAGDRESTIFWGCLPPETQEYVRKFLAQR